MTNCRTVSREIEVNAHIPTHSINHNAFGVSYLSLSPIWIYLDTWCDTAEALCTALPSIFRNADIEINPKDYDPDSYNVQHVGLKLFSCFQRHADII